MCSIFMNHCMLSLGSITALVRSEVCTMLPYSSTFTSKPATSKSFTMLRRAANRSCPTYSSALSLSVPLSLRMSTMGRLCFTPKL